MTAQIIHTEDHNGIPVMWSDIRSTYSGALILGIGIQDEPVRLGGVTHLLEHLVMNQVGKVLINHNATTNDVSLAFYAQGPERLVADFLHRVAESICSLESLTYAAVHAEAAHIAAEMADANERTGTGPLLEQYGAATLGLLDLGAPAHRSLTREDAISWGRTWLHAGNAVLTFSGPVPADLDVVLPPAADTPERPEISRLPYRRTGWVGGGRVPLAVSLDIGSEDRAVKFVTSLVIERALFEDLRERRHLVYSVDGHVGLVSHETSALTHVMDPQPDDILATAEAALDVLRGLAADGPPQELLDRIVEEWRNLEEDSDTLYGFVVSAASRWVRDGVEPLGIDHEPMASVTVEHVRAVLETSLSTVLVSLGEFATDLTPEQVTERLALPWAKSPEGHYESMGSGRKVFSALMRSGVDTFDAKTFSGRRGHQIIVDPERITMSVPNFGNVEARWDRLVLAGRCTKCGMWDLTDDAGEGVLIQPSQWRGGDKLASKVSSYVTSEVRYPLDHAAWH